MTAAVWLLNFALNANPIVLLVTAIAVLVASLIYLWTTSETFRGVVIGVFREVRDFIVGVVDWIVDRWNGLVDWFEKLPGRVGRALASIGSVISEAFKGAGFTVVGLDERAVLVDAPAGVVEKWRFAARAEATSGNIATDRAGRDVDDFAGLRVVVGIQTNHEEEIWGSLLHGHANGSRYIRQCRLGEGDAVLHQHLGHIHVSAQLEGHV